MENIKVKLELDTTEAQQQAKALMDSLVNTFKSASDALNNFLSKQQELKSALAEETALIEKMAQLKNQTGTVEDAQNLKNLEAIKNRIVQLRIELDLLDRRWQLMNQGNSAATNAAQAQVTNNNNVNASLTSQNVNLTSINNSFTQLIGNVNIANQATQNLGRSGTAVFGLGGVFSVVGALTASFREISSVMEKMEQSLDKMYAASTKLKDMNKTFYDLMTPVYNAMGASGQNPLNQSLMNNTIMNLVKTEKLDQNAVISSAAQLLTQVPDLNIVSGGGNDVLTEISRYAQRGVEPALAINSVIDKIKMIPAGNAPANIGEMINQDLANSMAIAGPGGMNTYLASMAQNKTKYEMAGFRQDDYAKIRMALTSRGLAPEAASQAETMYFTGMSRFAGQDLNKNFEEYVKVQMGDADYYGKESDLNLINDKNFTLSGRMNILKQRRQKGKGTPQLDAMMENSIKTGKPLTPAELESAFELLPQTEREELMRTMEGSGSKSIAGQEAVYLAGGLKGITLPTNAPRMPSPMSAVEQGTANEQWKKYDMARRNVPNPSYSDILQDMENWKTHLEKNPDQYPPIQNPLYARNMVPDFIKNVFSGQATKDQIYKVNSFASELVDISRRELELESISNPSDAEKTELQQLQNVIGTSSAALGLNTSDDESVKNSYIYKLTHGLGYKNSLIARREAAKNLENMSDQAQDFKNALNYSLVSPFGVFDVIDVLHDSVPDYFPRPTAGLDSNLSKVNNRPKPTVHYNEGSLIGVDIQTGPTVITPESGANMLNPNFVPPPVQPMPRTNVPSNIPPVTTPSGTYLYAPKSQEDLGDDIKLLRKYLKGNPNMYQEKPAQLKEKLRGPMKLPVDEHNEPVGAGPTSINYIRNTNYGYSYDMIGASESRPNFFG